MNILFRSTAALVILLNTICHSVAAPKVATEQKVILVSHKEKASWHDLAFLAAIPASRKVNQGNGAVIALNEQGMITPEIHDFLIRLKPRFTYHLGNNNLSKKPSLGKHSQLFCNSADEASVLLSQTFWKNSNGIIICNEDDYASALIASSLAARLKIPLLFSNKKGLSKNAHSETKRLKPKKLLFIGNAPTALQKLTNFIELPTPESVIEWLTKRGIKTSYVALTNSRDRSSTRVRKLSLAAPIFSAARNGLVLPIDNQTIWRENFNGRTITDKPPTGIQTSSKEILNKGTIVLPEGKLSYIIKFTKDQKQNRVLWIDLNNDGNFNGPGEGPHTKNRVITLFGKTRTLEFRERDGPARDITVTTSNVNKILRRLKSFYSVAGIPKYLCLVGFPDSIPMAIMDHRSGNKDLNSDFPYSNIDADRFSEIAVGRIIAENSSYATLHASRTITYHQLLDPKWALKAGQARWQNNLSSCFENIGLNATAYHNKIPFHNISPSSPLTQVGFISHCSHSSWNELGETYSKDSNTLLSPAVIESGGCHTGNLDVGSKFDSVISRMFRNGAISFVGQTRRGIAQQEQQRVVFWNALVTGLTIGESHKKSQNSKAALSLDKKQLNKGPDYYQFFIRTLFGDPAFKPKLPLKPRSKAARVVIKKNIISVYAPEKWWTQKITIPKDWKMWYGKSLYSLRGLGSYPDSAWSSEKYNKEKNYIDVTFTTRKKIKSIKQLGNLPNNLGWNGKYSVDLYPSNAKTYYWRVCLVDFDQKTGKIIQQVKRVDFQIN